MSYAIKTYHKRTRSEHSFRKRSAKKATRKINFRIVKRQTHRHWDQKPEKKIFIMLLLWGLTNMLKMRQKIVLFPVDLSNVLYQQSRLLHVQGKGKLPNNCILVFDMCKYNLHYDFVFCEESNWEFESELKNASCEIRMGAQCARSERWMGGAANFPWIVSLKMIFMGRFSIVAQNI